MTLRPSLSVGILVIYAVAGGMLATTWVQITKWSPHGWRCRAVRADGRTF